jgi:hypothetical protein
LKVLPRKTFRNFGERSHVCMVSRAQRDKWGHGDGYMYDRKKEEKTKEAHDSIMTTFYFILLIN